MENLDSTAITTAIPQMASDFKVSAVTMSMGITAYVIMLAVFVMLCFKRMIAKESQRM